MSGRGNQLNWMNEAEAEAEDYELKMLIEETKGPLEKLAEGNMRCGSWQMVLWQPRCFSANLEGAAYQKITAEGKAFGRVKRLPYSGIMDVVELEFCEFAIQCEKRDCA